MLSHGGPIAARHLGGLGRGLRVGAESVGAASRDPALGMLMLGDSGETTVVADPFGRPAAHLPRHALRTIPSRMRCWCRSTGPMGKAALVSLRLPAITPGDIGPGAASASASATA